LRSVLFGIGFDGSQLVFEQQLGFEQQTANQGTFAIVHASTSDEAQQTFMLVGLQVALDIFSNQIG